jgi:phosphoribosylformimino-5-aminoimidazole carboxamide ribotide isomerase
VTSYLFPDAQFSLERLEALSAKVGGERLVVDISCRKREKGWVVAMNGWKTLTDTYVTKGQ